MPTSARHTRALVPIRLAGMEGHIRFKRHLKRSADLKNKSDLHLTNSSLLPSRQRTSCHISFSGSNITTQLNCMGLCSLDPRISRASRAKPARGISQVLMSGNPVPRPGDLLYAEVAGRLLRAD